MNKEFKNIIFSIENEIAKISLNRPEVLNSFNYQMADEVIMAFMHCKENNKIRAIILTGEGRAF